MLKEEIIFMTKPPESLWDVKNLTVQRLREFLALLPDDYLVQTEGMNLCEHHVSFSTTSKIVMLSID